MDEPGALRTGRHARPVSSPSGTFPDTSRDRNIERIKVADRALADAHAHLRTTGVDADLINSAFATAHAALMEAREIVREAHKELILVQHEWDQMNQRRQNPGRYPDTIAPAVPDTPGLNLCPDPSTAQTSGEFMNTLRTYRIWAGKPSYRAMENVIKNHHQCGQRFAHSTIHAALKGNDLPTLQLVQAVITACGGSDAHQQIFTTAWRRLTMPHPDDAQHTRPRALHFVSESA